MNVYVAHSTGYDFRSELYSPLKTLSGGVYNFIFPHEDNTTVNSKEIIRQCDIVLAEVSYPSTGQGIELGWANDTSTPIICIHKAGAKISGSLSMVCDTFVEYTSPEDMVEKVESTLGSSRSSTS